MNTKYWTVTIKKVQGKTIITSEGLPYTNKREAIAGKALMHSSNAVVVKADANSNPTTEVIG